MASDPPPPPGWNPPQPPQQPQPGWNAPQQPQPGWTTPQQPQPGWTTPQQPPAPAWHGSGPGSAPAGGPPPPKGDRRGLLIGGISLVVVLVVGGLAYLLVTAGGAGEPDTLEVAWTGDVDQDLSFGGVQVVGDRVIAQTQAGQLRAFALDDGDVAWTIDELTSGDVYDVVAADHGLYAIHATGDDGSAQLRAFDLASGDAAWSFLPEVDEDSFLTPRVDAFVVAPAGLAVLSARELIGLGPDGSSTWVTGFPREDALPISPMAGVEELILLSMLSLDDDDATEVRAFDASTGDERWRADPPDGRVRSIHGSAAGIVVLIEPIRGGDTLAVGLDPADGSVRFEVDLGENTPFPPVVGGDAAAFTLEDRIIVLDLVDGEERFEVEFDETRTYADVHLADGEVHLVMGPRLEVLDATTGEVERTVSFGTAVSYGRPTYVDGTYLVPTAARELSAFR